MDVFLYKTTSPPNKVKKTLNEKTEINDVRFIEDGSLDVLNPSILISYNSDIGTITKFNYLRIPKFDRYYFIDKISTEGGLIRIDGKVDVLMSHKDDILSSKQYIIRQQSKNNSPYLEDNMLPIRSDHNYYAKPFGNYVDDRTCGRIILATTGNGGTVI